MKRSCPYCGGIHYIGYICPRKPKKKDKRTITTKDKFRWTKEWQDKRTEIGEERDHYLCQICIRNLYNTVGSLYNYRDISCHHIEPLEERFDLRLDDDNLIDLCAYHHAMADKGEIPRGVLHSIAKEQNEKQK